MSKGVETKEILWVLECHNGYCYELFPFFATNEEEAEIKAQQRMKQAANAVTLTRKSLRPYPNGFTSQHMEKTSGVSETLASDR